MIRDHDNGVLQEAFAHAESDMGQIRAEMRGAHREARALRDSEREYYDQRALRDTEASRRLSQYRGLTERLAAMALGPAPSRNATVAQARGNTIAARAQVAQTQGNTTVAQPPELDADDLEYSRYDLSNFIGRPDRLEGLDDDEFPQLGGASQLDDPFAENSSDELAQEYPGLEQADEAMAAQPGSGVGALEQDVNAELHQGESGADEEPEADENEADATPTPNARGGRPRKPLKKVAPLPMIVRNSQNNGWDTLQSLSSRTREIFEVANSRMATTKKWAPEYARFVRSKDTTGSHCVQCQVITRKGRSCGLGDADTACSTCIKLGRPCAKLIQHNGQDTLAWLPLPVSERSDAAWTDIDFWCHR